MNHVAQPQAQQAPRLPRDAAIQRRQEVIDLISEDEDVESGSEDLDFEEGDLFVDAPQSPVRPQDPALGRDQQEAVFHIIDLMDHEPLQIVPPFPAPARPASPPPARNQEWGDYYIDDDDGFDAAEFAQALENEEEWRFVAGPPAPGPPIAPHQQAAPLAEAPVQQVPQLAAIAEPKDECIQIVAAVFPGICLDHVSELYNKISKSSERLIAHLLDQMDKGVLYPKAKDKAKDLKRKREVDEIEEAARKYGAPDRVISANVGGIRPYIRNILSHEFPDTPMAFIDATLSQSGHRLFSAYQLLDEAGRTYNPLTSGYTKIKTARKAHTDFREESIETLLSDPTGDLERGEILRELRAARKYKAKADAKREDERLAALEEEENERRAQAEGTIEECVCCFGDYPLNRMVHCDADEMHWFCRGCALRNAETEVGQSKYELCCMSMEGCDAKFTLSQRAQFLDEKTKIALERNEQEANLRLAGIENLASCPFCPFAAEYPPVEVDREFRCQAPDCEKISCRLCNLESHIPKSCEENAKETGLSVRRRIEEAMSAALIRKCNKCGTPFIKEEGCNKMRCTLKGCGNVQCYVCSKSCDYDHFDDRGRGGKPGNCPLFESVETRHDEEVSKAEKEALEQVRAEHPEYTEDDLKVKVSEDVKKDDERRRARDPRLNPAVGRPVPIYRGFPLQEMNAVNAIHYQRQFMNRRIPRPAGADPALPVLPDQGPGGDLPYLPREPYLGRRIGDAGPPNLDGMFDDVDDMGIFNMPWGDDFGFPPPPGAPPPGFQIPLPPPGLAAPAMPPLAAARPGGGMFENRFRRHPGEQPPQLGLEQDIDWRNPAGVPPLPEYRAAVDDNQGRLTALQERMTDRTRLRRAEAVKNEAQPENDLHVVAVRQHIEQAKAARQLALGQQARQARAAREMVLPNIVLPEAPQPLPRQVLSAAVANAVAAREARDAERRRRLEEQVGKAAVNLRMERLREIAQKNERNNEDENKRRLREQMDRIQALQDRARAIGQDGGEDVRPRNERLERLRQRLVNQNNANNEANGSNEDGNNAAADDGPPLLRGTYYRIRRSEQAPAALPQPAAALRQQQILDHEERRIERSQLMARLRREQENDEAATAKRLARLRQNGAAAAAQSPRHRQGQVFELLSPSPEVKKKARLFDMADEADDEEDEDEDEEW